MDYRSRWNPCVAHNGNDCDRFLGCYFSEPGRLALLVAGAGFDPRSCTVAQRLANAATTVRALLIREDRPNPPQAQSSRADENTNAIINMLPYSQVESIDIFGQDGAVVGGRNIISVLRNQNLNGVTDVVVDISALSAGTMFPIIRYFVELIGRHRRHTNLHVVVVHDPLLDNKILAVAGDVPAYVHGFRGRSTLSEAGDAARLWLPQLAFGMREAFARLYDFVEPHDTCPILPFPATDPRLGDRLAEEYLVEFESTWSVDTRNIVYGDEGDPLDLYRTLLRLEDLRRPVFAETGGSMLILSPHGSKVMALGALMAALERDLPVAYIESIGYAVAADVLTNTVEPRILHLWLEGEAYPLQRATI